MPYLMNPANYTQTFRPNLYNMAYRRIGGYKGMGRLHPSNYLEIGSSANRVGATTGQYNTLSTQLSLLPPSLRGLGAAIPVWNFRERRWVRGRSGVNGLGLLMGRGLGQGSTAAISASTPGLISGVLNYSDILGASPGGGSYINPGTGVTTVTYGGDSSIDPTTYLMIAGGAVLLLLLMTGRR